MHLGETLSSDTLFHFTGKREYLENIIERGFYPRYCTEDLSMFSSVIESDIKNYEFGVPMVCFCDIPLSKVKEHISVYKGYGIGCTKAWGIERGVTPLVYVKPTSETVRGIQNALLALRSFSVIDQLDAIKFGNVRDHLTHFMRFVKPYEGRFEHNDQIFENKRFYDEREWRYVPSIDETKSKREIQSWIGKDLLHASLRVARNLMDYDFLQWPESFPGDTPWIHQHLKIDPPLFDLSDKDLLEVLFQKLRQELNAKIQTIPELALPVDPLTIKYIIVEQEEDVVPISDVLNKRFRNEYSGATMTRLMTRIITLEQIKDDF